MRILSVLLVVWLVIGAIAGAQRGYYNSSHANCARAGTIAVTIVAGPAQLRRCEPEGLLHAASAEPVTSR